MGRIPAAGGSNAAGVRAFLARYLPDALGPEIYTKTCLYTLTPDRDFVLDAVPEAEGVFVAIGAVISALNESLRSRIGY